jgi:uncharacterized protein DUF5658
VADRREEATRGTPAEAPPVAPSTAAAQAPSAPPPGFVDRRRRPTPMLSRYSFFGGRRRQFASPADAEDAYVDVYNTRLALLVLVFFALTMFDAIATVYYIDHAHGSEWNPIADWMLQRGRIFFVMAKGVPTGLMLLFVMIHKNFRYGRIALAIGFGFYFLLGVYHVYLQAVAWSHTIAGY